MRHHHDHDHDRHRLTEREQLRIWERAKRAWFDGERELAVRLAKSARIGRN